MKTPADPAGAQPTEMRSTPEFLLVAATMLRPLARRLRRTLRSMAEFAPEHTRLRYDDKYSEPAAAAMVEILGQLREAQGELSALIGRMTPVLAEREVPPEDPAARIRPAEDDCFTDPDDPAADPTL